MSCHGEQSELAPFLQCSATCLGSAAGVFFFVPDPYTVGIFFAHSCALSLHVPVLFGERK